GAGADQGPPVLDDHHARRGVGPGLRQPLGVAAAGRRPVHLGPGQRETAQLRNLAQLARPRAHRAAAGPLAPAGSQVLTRPSRSAWRMPSTFWSMPPRTSMILLLRGARGARRSRPGSLGPHPEL